MKQMLHYTGVCQCADVTQGVLLSALALSGVMLFHVYRPTAQAYAVQLGS